MTSSATLADRAAGFLPLSPPVFQILLSLHLQPLHGYAIIQDVGERTRNEVRLTASTLYDALSRLLDQRLIDETSAAAAAARTAATSAGETRSKKADARRRYYTLTPLGQAVARAEARRLERLVAMARQQKVFGRK
jgi:PadR family transcriptional regulator, regulatory protein PadR